MAISRTARSESVRTSRGTPAWALARMPAASGRSDAPCRRAPPDDDDEIGGGHADLGDGRRPGGSCDAQARHRTTSPSVEGCVGGEAADGDIQRSPGVLEAAQYTGRGEHDQHGRDAEAGYAEIGRWRTGRAGRRLRRAWTSTGRRGEGDRDDDGARGTARARCRPSPGGWLPTSRPLRHGGRRRPWWRRRGRRRRSTAVIQERRRDPVPGELGDTADGRRWRCRPSRRAARRRGLRRRGRRAPRSLGRAVAGSGFGSRGACVMCNLIFHR